MLFRIPLALGLLACSTLEGSGSATAADGPEELGQVAFSRDFEATLRRADALDRPVFALFQEVPGCATCVSFGRGPLSQPLLVEAIEELFVPVAVYNNRGGADGEVLQRFGEPAWNNPVVRFLDADGSELIPRRAGIWDTRGVALRADAALRAAGAERPAWFALLVTELDGSPTETAVFAMPCFWTGEARLGGLEGVVDTRPGWYAGREVVEVRYRPEQIQWPTLLERARSERCATRVWVSDEALVSPGVEAFTGRVRAAQPSDSLRALGRSSLRWLPLTPLQAQRVNADLAAGVDPERWLSPRQIERARRIHALGSDGARERLGGLRRPGTLEELPQYARQLERAL